MAAVWFAVWALIPVFITAIVVHPVVVLIVPIVLPVAAVWGFTFGAVVADVATAQSFPSVIFRGAAVALISFLTSVVLGYLFLGSLSGHTSLSGFANALGVTFVFGGWFAIFVGAAAGYGLHRHVHSSDRRRWILMQPRLDKARYAYLFRTGITVLSCVLIVIFGAGYFFVGKDAARKQLKSEIEIASMQGRADSLKKALSDPDLDAKFIQEKGTSLLLGALRSKHPETISVLLQFGADPNGIEGNNGSVLAHAACEDELEMMRLLISGGANVSLVNPGESLPPPYWDNKMSALICAAKNNNIEALELLLANGADANLRDRDGVTALGHVLKFRERIRPTEGRTSDLMGLNDAMIRSLKARGATE